MLKNYLLVALLMAPSFSLFAQDFGALGTEWYYSGNAGGTQAPNLEYIHFKSVKDSLISGQNTHKIQAVHHDISHDSTLLESGFYYQESDTVYKYNAVLNEFKKFLIFNASVGDTLVLDNPNSDFAQTPTYRLVIDQVTTETVDGIALKKYEVTALDDITFHGGFFMDRIGGLDWFSPRGIIIPEADGPIRCYKDAQVDSSFQNVACDYIPPVSVDEIHAKNTIQFHPNPVIDVLNISTLSDIETIKIYDLTGRLVLQYQNTSVDVSTLPNGHYIAVVETIKGEIHPHKFIKNTP